MADSQREVDSVVENVVNSPQFRSLITDVIQSSNRGTNASQTTSTRSNPPQSSQLSSISSNVASTSASTSNNPSRATFASPIAEFNAIFRRGASTSQQQRGGGTVASFLPGIAHYTERSRSRSTRSTRGRRSSSRTSASTASKPKANNVYTREVVLLNSPTVSAVVKGKKKADLLREGNIISTFDFCRSWSEEEVYQHLSMAFQDKLHSKRYIFINTSIQYFCVLNLNYKI